MGGQSTGILKETKVNVKRSEGRGGGQFPIGCAGVRHLSTPFIES